MRGALKSGNASATHAICKSATAACIFQDCSTQIGGVDDDYMQVDASHLRIKAALCPNNSFGDTKCSCWDAQAALSLHKTAIRSLTTMMKQLRCWQEITLDTKLKGNDLCVTLIYRPAFDHGIVQLQ